MTIENSVSTYFLSMFVDSFNVCDCRLSGVSKLVNIVPRLARMLRIKKKKNTVSVHVAVTLLRHITVIVMIRLGGFYLCFLNSISIDTCNQGDCFRLCRLLSVKFHFRHPSVKDLSLLLLSGLIQ